MLAARIHEFIACPKLCHNSFYFYSYVVEELFGREKYFVLKQDDKQIHIKRETDRDRYRDNPLKGCNS